MSEKTREDFEAALEAYRALTEKTLREHFDRNGFTFAVPCVKVRSRGRKNAILDYFETKDGETREHSTRVQAFVDIETGDVFKPASYRAPAKHARGNIYSPEGGAESLTADGHVRYLR